MSDKSLTLDKLYGGREKNSVPGRGRARALINLALPRGLYQYDIVVANRRVSESQEDCMALNAISSCASHIQLKCKLETHIPGELEAHSKEAHQ